MLIYFFVVQNRRYVELILMVESEISYYYTLLFSQIDNFQKYIYVSLGGKIRKKEKVTFDFWLSQSVLFKKVISVIFSFQGCKYE